MPISRILERESRDPQQAPPVRERLAAVGAGRASLAVGAIALATALTLVGAPAAEALGLI